MKLLFAAGLVALATTGYSQSLLTQTWKVDAGTRTYLPSSGDTVRGLGYNPVSNNLLVNNRVVLNRVNADTGATVEPAVPATGYSGGLYLINKVGVTTSGVVYVCNLALATNVFKIYRHADEASAPTVAYTEASAAFRMGDDMAVIGSGVDTKILVAGSSTDKLHIFSTVDGLTFTKQTVTPATPAVAGTPAIAWDTNGVDYWFRNSSSNLGAQKYSGLTNQGVGSPVGGGASSLSYGPIDIGQFGELQLLAVGVGASAAGQTGKPAEFYDTADNSEVYNAIGTELTGGAVANTNASGDVVFDEAGGRVFFLYTNNSLTAYDMGDASVGEWNLY